MDHLSSIRSLFTPSVLFLLLNLVIAAIALISTRHRRQQNPRPIARSSSSNVLESVRSLGLFRFRSGDLPPTPAASDDHAPSAPPPQDQQQEPIVHQQPQQQSRRIHSEYSASKEIKTTKVMGESASAMTLRSSAEVYAEISKRPAAVSRKAAAADEEVDAKADDFINRFRQQLKLQRLDSLLRYKGMLKAK